MDLSSEVELLCKALDAKFGIEVQFFGVSLDTAKNRLYKAARSDPMFSKLQIRRTSAGEDKLWVVKGSKDKSKGPSLSEILKEE